MKEKIKDMSDQEFVDYLKNEMEKQMIDMLTNPIEKIYNEKSEKTLLDAYDNAKARLISYVISK